MHRRRRDGAPEVGYAEDAVAPAFAPPAAARSLTQDGAHRPDADPSALAALRSLRRSYGYGSVARLASAASRRPGRRTPSWVRLLALIRH